TLLLPHLTKDDQKQQHRQYELFYSYHLLSQGLHPGRSWSFGSSGGVRRRCVRSSSRRDRRVYSRKWWICAVLRSERAARLRPATGRRTILCEVKTTNPSKEPSWQARSARSATTTSRPRSSSRRRPCSWTSGRRG